MGKQTNMKKIILLSFLFGVVFGQSDLYPVEEFYGGGIGYSLTSIKLASIPAASDLSKMGLDTTDFKSTFTIHGGEGFTHIAGRWRIGGYAGIGVDRISAVPTVMLYQNRDGVDGFQYDPLGGPTADTTVAYTGDYAPSIKAKLSFTLGAATVEYVMPLFRDLEIAAGSLIGLGRMNISINQHNGTARWDRAFSNIVYGEQDSSGTMYYEVTDFDDTQAVGLIPVGIPSRFTNVSGAFLNVQPYVAIKWQLLDRVGLRVSMGYNKGTISAGGWLLNDREPISDSPKYSAKGIAIRAMLYFGL